REPLAERAHVAGPERLALERAEEGVASREAEPLPAVEPAVHGLDRVGGERGCARLVPLAVEHAERTAGGVQVLRVERERLRDAEAAPEQHGQQGAVADAGRRAPRAGGAQRLNVGEGQGLGGESAARPSLHTYQTVRRRIQCRFSQVPTLYRRSDVFGPCRA